MIDEIAILTSTQQTIVSPKSKHEIKKHNSRLENVQQVGFKY